MKIQKAFTLVELIVVVTILAILSAVGFVTYSGYIAWVRDTGRLTSLNSMADALELYSNRQTVPIPDNNVEVRSSGSLVAWQGVAWENTLRTIEFYKWAIDPLTEKHFSYYVTRDRKSFQLLGFLEDSEKDKIQAVRNKVRASDEEYFLLYPKVFGNKIWILTTPDFEPIQENSIVTWSGHIDIKTTDQEYIAFLTEEEKITGTGAELQYLEWLLLAWDLRNSCKKILAANPRLTGKDGIYYINLNGPQKVYCDMTDKWGGWTRYVDIKWNYSFEDAKKCWLWIYSNNNIECFNPNQYSFVVSQYKADINSNTYYKAFQKEIPSKIYKESFSAWNCRGGREYMTAMQQGTYPNSTLSWIRYLWLGLSFCDDSAWWVGWIQENGSTTYMNSAHISTEWPLTGTANWESSADNSQLFVR